MLEADAAERYQRSWWNSPAKLIAVKYHTAETVRLFPDTFYETKQKTKKKYEILMKEFFQNSTIENMNAEYLKINKNNLKKINKNR